MLDKLKEIAKRAKSMREYITSEEGSKTSLVLPFFEALGYVTYDPTHIIPEYCADVGDKKKEKVDYAIIYGNKPVAIVECKPLGWDLLHKDSVAQLYRYFSCVDVRLAILTDGVKYCLFSDIDKPNVMDTVPFATLDIINLSEDDLVMLDRLKYKSLTHKATGILSLAKKRTDIRKLKEAYIAKVSEVEDSSDFKVKLINIINSL